MAALTESGWLTQGTRHTWNSLEDGEQQRLMRYLGARREAPA